MKQVLNQKVPCSYPVRRGRSIGLIALCLPPSSMAWIRVYARKSLERGYIRHAVGSGKYKPETDQSSWIGALRYACGEYDLDCCITGCHRMAVHGAHVLHEAYERGVYVVP